MWVSEQSSCCCSCSFSCCMVSLELVVLSPSYIFLTEVVLTRRFHFFVCSRLYPCQWRESWANWVLCGAWRELLHLEAVSCRNWQEEKSRGGESHWKWKDLQKSSNKAFSASRVKFRMQIPGCERVTWLRISTPEIFLSSCAVSLVLPATFIWSCHNFNKLSRFQFFYMND